jgi:hypothetical protein
VARLFTNGFENNSVTAFLDQWDFINNAPTINATSRTGSFAGAITSLTSAQDKFFSIKFASANTNGPVFARYCLRVTTNPNVSTTIAAFISSAGTQIVWTDLSTTGQLQCFFSGGTQVGVNVPLSTGQYYVVELMMDVTNTRVQFMVNGISYGNTTAASTITGVNQFRLGGNIFLQTCTTININFDDVAINDATGTFQNGWCGPGNAIYLRPSATGDANTFATQTGGTALAINNFTRVSQVTSDDATSFNGSNTLNQEDLMNLTDSAIPATSRVSVVELHARFNNNVADATTAIKFEIEKAAAGTKSQSAAIIPNSTTWVTNAISGSTVWQPPIRLYIAPDGSEWTQTLLDSMQAGYILSTGGTNAINVTQLYVIVEYVPALPIGQMTVSGTGR